MPTTVNVEELQRLTSGARQKEEKRQEEEFRKRLEEHKEEVKSIAEKIIQELPNRMKEAAKRGDTSVEVYSSLEKHYRGVKGYIQEFFIQKNPGTHGGEERIGRDYCSSDLVFYISWRRQR